MEVENWTRQNYTGSICSRLTLARVGNKFRWLLVRESTPSNRLPMRRHEGEELLKRREDNPADGQYAFPGPVFCRRDKLRRPLNARFLPAAVFSPSGRFMWTMHFVAFWWRPDDVAGRWDTKALLTVRQNLARYFTARFFTSKKKTIENHFII